MGIPNYFVKQSSVVDLAEVPWHMFTMKVLNYLLFVLVKQFFSNSKEKMDDGRHGISRVMSCPVRQNTVFVTGRATKRRRKRYQSVKQR